MLLLYSFIVNHFVFVLERYYINKVVISNKVVSMT